MKDPTPGTFHTQPDFDGSDEVAIDVETERALDMEGVAEVAFADKVLDVILETELGTTCAFPVAETALSWLRGWGTPSADPASRNGMRISSRGDILIRTESRR